jgi:hypothetical protein
MTAGTRVGPYVLEEVLGEGGTDVVYRGVRDGDALEKDPARRPEHRHRVRPHALPRCPLTRRQITMRP